MDQHSNETRAIALLTSKVQQLDVAKEAGRVALGATLLQDAQEHARQGERLLRQITAFLSEKNDNAEHDGRSLADRAAEVLGDSDGPRRYREIAAEIRGRGFHHSTKPKNPNQLNDSVWSAMHEDPRFVKVGRGIWDLAKRDGPGGGRDIPAAQGGRP